MPRPKHQPVLLKEVLELLRPTAGDSYLDLTVGYGGHAAAIIDQTKAPQQATLIDRDPKAAEALAEEFRDAELINSDFLAASQQLAGQGRAYDLILADLGISSPHLDEAQRGFSFNQPGPLDMRMDSRQALTAATIVNDWPEAEIAEILDHYGQEPKARRIARLIVAHRPLSTTTGLANLAKQAWPGHSRTHPATRTFQALRMAVNDELGQVSQSLPVWLEMLKPEGRLAVISFHSLEDRLVKDFLAENSGDRYDSQLQLLTKKPVVATTNEINNNPRARSAKLRAAVKIKTKGSKGK